MKRQAMRLWDNGRVLRAWLGCEELFPLVIPAAALTPGQLPNDLAAVKNWKNSIEQHCQCHLGHGYRVEYAVIEHSRLGRLRLPARLVFDQAYDLAAFIDKGRDVKRFAQLLGQIRRSDARLMPWCQRYPLKVLQYENDWDRLLSLLDYLKLSPVPDNLPVDSRFISQHKLLIGQLLDLALPEYRDKRDVQELLGREFERGSDETD